MSLPKVTRRMFEASDKKRDAGLTTPDDIIRFDDISYGRYGKWNLLDVYRPKKETVINMDDHINGSQKKLPVIVSVHGGGWVYGDKDVYQHYCMSLASRGFAVVNYTYRLAPEDKFPASLYDTDAVFRWIYENADYYGLDTDNVYAVGDSAGANLLAIYINLINDSSYVEKLNNYICTEMNKKPDIKPDIKPGTPLLNESVVEADYINDKDINDKDINDNDAVFKPQENIKIKAVALNCGKYSFEVEKENKGLKDIVNFLFVNDGTAEELDLIDVIAHASEKFPPAFIMTATGDFLLKEAGKLCRRFEELGVPFEYHFYSEGENPLGHVFHCNMRLYMAHICNDEECGFFRKYIG